MASIDSFLGSSLQNLNTLDKKIANDGSDENMKKVVEYLYTLTEQLRYMFNNLDTENFTDGVFHRTIRDETTQQYTQIVQTNDALTAIVAGLNAAQKAAKLTFDAEGLSIQNGGFKILDDNNNTTMSVSNSGDINIVGSYKTDAYSDSSNNSQWSEWDEAMLNFYYKPTGGSTEVMAKIGQARNLITGKMIDEGVIATKKGVIYIAEDLTASPLVKYVELGMTEHPLVGPYGWIWLSDENTVRLSIDAFPDGPSLTMRNASGQPKIRANITGDTTGNIYADYYNNNSSRRYKKDITDMSDEQAQKLLDLNFVKFKYKDSDTYNYGLIAEDTPLDEVVVCDAEGRPDAIDYTKLIPYMGKLIQDINTRLERLEKAS